MNATILRLSPYAVLAIVALLVAPGFIFALPGDEFWSDDFGPMGTNGAVNALIEYKGTLYAGGAFTSIDGTPISHIAQWDGSRWVSVGGGVDGEVRCFIIDNDRLMVGGAFIHAGTIRGDGLAGWDGSTWMSIGGGVSGAVNSLTRYGTNLVVGGAFSQVGGSLPASNIAIWNGATWSSLGSGTNSEVKAMVVHGTSLVASGEFDTAGGIAAVRIARWNGASWSNLGSGLVGAAAALASHGGILFAGRGHIGGGTSAGISAWNGLSWTATPGLSSGGSLFQTPARSFFVVDGQLFVTGYLRHESYVLCGVLKWSGATWMQVDGAPAVNSAINSVAVIGARWVYGGQYSSPCSGVIASEGDNLSALSSSRAVGGVVNAILADSDSLIIGGSFSTAGPSLTQVQNIAALAESEWLRVGGGVNGAATGLQRYAGALAVAGQFSIAGETPAERIALWTGTNWIPLGAGINANVLTMTAVGTRLYVGGEFSQAGGNNVLYLAQWDGAEWSEVAGGLNGPAYASARYRGALVVGGVFTSAGGAPCQYLAMWDGVSWIAMPGLDGPIRTLGVYDGQLVASGAFDFTGTGHPASNIAIFNGSEWRQMGGGINGQAYAMVEAGGKLFVGGDFTQAGTTDAHHVAVWDGAEWQPLGSGTNGLVRAIAWVPPHLYVGGDFSTAGGKSAAFMTRWDGLRESCVVEVHEPAPESLHCSGAPLRISWYYAGQCDGTANIDLYQHGAHRQSIAMGIAVGDTSILAPVLPAAVGDGYTIRLSGPLGNWFDSSGEFSILPGGELQLAAPNGGTRLIAGVPREILWQSSGCAGQFARIELLLSGSICTILADSVPNTGSYVWNVGNCMPASDGYRIRIVDCAYGSADESDSDFSIVQPSQLIAMLNVTDSHPGLDDYGSGNSVAWLDFDDDGDLDLSVGAGAGNINRLYLNRLAETGTVSFDLSSDPLIASPNTTRGLAWGALDAGDHCPDLYQGLPFGANALLNNSCGDIVDVTNSVTAGTSSQTNGVRVIDLDRDGRLDIHELRPDAPDRLLRNLGGWDFAEMQTSPLSIVEGSFDAAWGDVDGDGDQDVYVVRDAPWPNVLLRNDGGGTFAEVTSALLAITDRSQGATWGDYDNDGDLDLFVTNWDAPNRLFRNDGSFVFALVTVPGMEVVRRGQSAVWGDLNNDGWLDLYVANQGDPNQLWLNVTDGAGGRALEDVSYSEVADLGPSTGVSMADYDQDGDLDIYVGAHLGANTLLRNELPPGGHWLQVDLVATQSNGSAIGSRLTVSAGGVTMIREVGANNGMWSQEPMRQHFGLGAAADAVHIAVAWASGAETELDPVSIDRVIAIVEPEVAPQPLTFTDIFADSGFSNWTYVNQSNVVDFDGDGWDDLFFARRDGMTPRLYINDRAGHFEEDNSALGALEGLMVEMVDFGDIDHNGDLDILARMADNSLRIFLREGGSYTDQTPGSLLAARFGDVGLIDSDNDGDLDIVGKSGSSLSSGDLQLFVNNTMSFSPVVIASGITWVAIADLDRDGRADLVTTDRTSHRLFRNSGSNLFVELTNTGLAPNVHYEACFFDYDNDGDLDVYGGNPDWPDRRPRLSRNDGNMVFLDATQESMSVGQHYYAAAIAADPDRDGDLDYYNTLGTNTNGLFFENQGGAFAERSGQYGINVGGPSTTKTGVWIDFDRDHDLDLLVVNTWNANGGWLFRNDVEAGNWLEVQPIATQSNSSLRGVEVTAYWDGASQIQHYEFNASYYPASRSRTKHFGLGGATAVDSIVVRWPSGIVSVKRNVPVNRVIQVQEMARPEFVAIEDYPGDQGGKLSLTFSTVVEGASDGGGLFTQYEVQRWDNGGWITAATIPANGVDTYQVIVETPDILTIGQPPRFTKLRVAATMMGEMAMSLSAIDSAYSIDNLPPPKPVPVLVESPDYRYIVWTNPDQPDFASACVFRGTEAGFTPGDALTCPDDGIFVETHLAWYFYRVQFADTHGNLSDFSDELHGQWPTGVPGALPTVLRLHPCRPNPFNPRTMIRYDLPEAGPVRLSVFDLAGRLVRTLVDESKPQGTFEAAWDGRDATGREVGSGAYLARLSFGGRVETVRMGLVR